MHQSISSFHPKIGNRQANRSRLAKPTAAPIVRTPVSVLPKPEPCLALPLPSFKAIPDRYIVQHNVAKTAKALLAFMDLGLVDKDDLEQPWTVETEILERSFSRWIENNCYDLELFHPCITIGDFLDSDDTKNSDILFGFTTNSMEYLSIGEKAAEIEAASTGLGETLLHHLGRSFYATLVCVFPESALDYARHVYWMGEDDESTYVEEVKAYGEEPDDVEIFRRADFLAEIPEWAADPKEKLEEKELQRLTKNSNNIVAETAQVALELIAANRKEGYHPPSWEGYDYTECVDPALFIRWNTNDAIERVFDDFYQLAIQAECTDLHGVYGVKPEREEISKALEGVAHFFEILRTIEKALKLIAVKL